MQNANFSASLAAPPPILPSKWFRPLTRSITRTGSVRLYTDLICLPANLGLSLRLTLTTQWRRLQTHRFPETARRVSRIKGGRRRGEPGQRAALPLTATDKVTPSGDLVLHPLLASAAKLTAAEWSGVIVLPLD